MKQAVFLDLNGTLVEPVRVDSLDELGLIEGAFEAVVKLNKAGFICPVITVQSRIAKGYFSEQEFLTWFNSFKKDAAQHNAEILGPFVCPHRFKDKETCICEKPKPYLYEQAAREYDIDLKNSIVIGDTASDIEAGIALGTKSCLVSTGWGYEQSNQDKAVALNVHIASNLLEAVNWFLASLNT